MAVNRYTQLVQARVPAGVTVTALCPGTQHSKMKLTREETVSVADSADTAAYLATLAMPGVGDCSVAGEELPRGAVLWHDLTPLEARTRDQLQMGQETVSVLCVACKCSLLEIYHLLFMFMFMDDALVITYVKIKSNYL